MKSCINVNHYLLLVRRHLKYVWFTKFWGGIKNGPSLAISKKLSASGAKAHWPPDQGQRGPYGGSAPRPPSVPPAPNLPLHHCVWLLHHAVTTYTVMCLFYTYDTLITFICMYVQGGPKSSRKRLSISSPNIDRFSKCFYRHILWNICNKIGYYKYHHTLTASLHYLVKYKSVKFVNIWWRCEQEFEA